MSVPNSTARNKHSYSAGFAKPSIDITKEELSRISEALKKEEFRKLFLDYCEEIQDPENRKRYEDEIKQLEAERGVEVRFINPEPGFVVKTSDGQLKSFINIARSPEVAKPTSEVNSNYGNGDRGITWALPMAQAPPRDDLDAHNKRCRVYDVVFHPDALHLAKRNNEFRKCLIDTALDAVEREYKVKLDRTNLKFPKLDYKGVARPTVIRKLAENPPPEADEPHPLDNIYPAKPTAESGNPKTLPIKKSIPPQPDYATPKYVIKHRRGIDLTEFTQELDAKLNVTVPRELVVEIELPLLSSAAECQLDVTEKSVYLLSERTGAKYRLKLELPYAVNDREGAARFDTDTRRLSITLPVIQPNIEHQRDMHNTLLHLNREDSGVESDVREESSSSDGSSPSESPTQDVEAKYSQEEETEASLSELHSVKSLPEINLNSLMKANIPYKFPEKFDCNVLDNTMSFVLHVRNVQPESLIKLLLPRSLHLHFTSIGTGYYPSYYAFYIQLPTDSNVKILSSDAEAWENNVVLNLNLNGPVEQLQTYLVGVNSSDLKSFSIRNPMKSLSSPRSHKSSLLIPSGPFASTLDIVVERVNEPENNIEIEIKPREQPSSSTLTNGTSTSDGEGASLATGAGGDAQTAQKKLSRKQRKRQKKERSLSESACDDIKNALKVLEAEEQTSNKATIDGETANSSISTVMPQTPRKQRSYSECRGNNGELCSSPLPCKGILKHSSRYAHTVRSPGSDSCSSSVEDCSSFSSSVDNGGPLSSLHFSKSFSDIPEENASTSLSESCKKTVRFNDIIQKQIFRLDSSILGQRKKNQKRRDRKQRALQRRLSEGDSAEYEEDHKALVFKDSTELIKVKTIASKNTTTANGDGNNDSNSAQDNSDDTNVVQQEQKPLSKENPHPNTKPNKGKKKRQATPRRYRQESESSDVDGTKGAMMFEIDLE